MDGLKGARGKSYRKCLCKYVSPFKSQSSGPRTGYAPEIKREGIDVVQGANPLGIMQHHASPLYSHDTLVPWRWYRDHKTLGWLCPVPAGASHGFGISHGHGLRMEGRRTNGTFGSFELVAIRSTRSILLWWPDGTLKLVASSCSLHDVPCSVSIFRRTRICWPTSSYSN